MPIDDGSDSVDAAIAWVLKIEIGKDRHEGEEVDQQEFDL